MTFTFTVTFPQWELLLPLAFGSHRALSKSVARLRVSSNKRSSFAIRSPSLTDSNLAWSRALLISLLHLIRADAVGHTLVFWLDRPGILFNNGLLSRIEAKITENNRQEMAEQGARFIVDTAAPIIRIFTQATFDKRSHR